MPEMIISQGTPDSQLFLQAVANVSAPYNVTPKSGNYPSLVNNVLVNRRLASSWLAVHLASRAFVDGLGVTSVGAESENVGFIRFPMMYMPPRLKRTLGSKLCPTGEYDGTPGNNAPFNKNLPHGIQTDGYDMKFMQVYDEAAQISKANMRMVGTNLDLLGQYTANIPKLTGLLVDSDVLASQTAAGLARGYQEGNVNIIAYDPTEDKQGYLQGLMNSLLAKLSNVRGSYKEGIISYPRDKSVIVMRQEFFDQLMTINNGAIINSDVGQKILLNGYLDDSGEKLMGSYIAGRYGGVYIKVLPDEMWDTAAATLGLTAAQYAQWNKVMAYVANAEGTLLGMSATVTDVDKSPTTSMGFIVRNDWGWGVKVVRPSSIALIVKSENNLADFTNPIHTFDDITSPANMEGIIEGYQNADASVETIQRAAITTPQLVTVLTITVDGPEDGTAEVVVRAEDGTYPTVSNEGNGDYKFVLPRASTATVVASAEGYTAQSLAITAANTATAAYSAAINLT